MAGLLDDPSNILFASLLAPGAFGSNLQKGLLGMNQAQQQQKENELKGLLYGAQIKNYEGDAALNRAKIKGLQDTQTRSNQFLGIGTPGAAPALDGGGGGGGGGGGDLAPGLPAFTAQAISQKFGIPIEAVVSDHINNGGKKIAEMIEGRSKPNYQNVGGNLVDTNAPGFQGGLQDQVNFSTDGKGSIFRANGGNPVMGAIPGALQTYGAFEDIKNRTGAAYAPGRPVIGPDNRQYGQSQLAEIGGASAQIPGGMGRAMPATGPTNAGERGMAAQVAGVTMDVPSEIAKTTQLLQSGAITNPNDRAAAAQYIQYLQSQGGAPAQAAAPSSPAGALGFSPQEVAQQEAEATRLKNTAAAGVVRDTDSATKTRAATENLSNADRAMQLLRQGPTSSAVGNLVDKGMGAFGVSNPGANLAAQLDIVSANMVKNVPRFEGPQSNIDVEGYKSAAGRVADRNLPIDQRLAAAEEVKRYEQKAIATGGGYKSGGATGSWDSKPTPAKQLLDSIPTANASNRGRKLRDTQTGQMLESDGMQWKPVK